MDVRIRSREIPVTEALRLHVNRRLSFALDRFANRIGTVTVRVRDLNGPRGGRDKCCRMELKLSPLGRVVIDERADDLLVAIDKATDRLGASIARLLKKTRHMKTSIRYLNPRSDADAA